jgi:putative two-component system response regulator
MTAYTMLARLAALHNPTLAAHERRVGHYAGLLCEALGLADDATASIGAACVLHDLGKLAIPDAILLKPDRLTQDEIGEMRRHTLLGHEILSEAREPLLDLAARIALWHHERFDGSGYPHGLKGPEIPLEARIAAVCDVYDALREDRVYRPGLSHRQAMQAILGLDGRFGPEKFDPDVLAVLARRAELFSDAFVVAAAA